MPTLVWLLQNVLGTHAVAYKENTQFRFKAPVKEIIVELNIVLLNAHAVVPPYHGHLMPHKNLITQSSGDYP